MPKKTPKTTADIATELAAAFELSMHRLTLLGHHLPKVAEGMTPQQLKLLTILAYAPAPLTMAKAAAQVGVTPGTLTEGVKRLTKAGMITRQRAAEDDRVVNLTLSPAGQKLVGAIRQSRVAMFRRLCADLDEAVCRDLIASHLLIAEIYGRVVQHKQGDAS